MPDAPIVVATDLSARSDRATDRAFLIGREQSRPVVVVHVIEEKDVDAEDVARWERQVRETLPDSSADAEIVLTTGSPPGEIARIGNERGAGLLVTGVARLNSLRDYILGTAVDHIVRHATMPVLVVKQRAHRPYRLLVAGTDFSEASREGVLAASRLFPDGRIEVLHAYHVPFESWSNSEQVRQDHQDAARAELDRFLAHPDLASITAGRLSGRVAYGGIEAVVTDTIEEFAPDLLVLGTHGESGFRHATIGSTANELLSCTAIDTLMVPPLP